MVCYEQILQNGLILYELFTHLSQLLSYKML